MRSLFSGLAGKTALVTGAGGFIGAHLCAALQQHGCKVCGLVRETSRTARLEELKAEPALIYADIADLEGVRQQLDGLNPDYVYHLAINRDRDDWQAVLQTNVTGSLNLLHAVNHPAIRRFVMIGSSLDTGVSGHGVPADFYGATRAAMRLLLFQQARSMAIPLTHLRTFYVYGPLQARTKLIPTAIRAARAGRALALTRAGLRRDYVYVADLVDACLRAVSVPSRGICEYDIATDKQWANEEVADLLGQIMGKKLDVRPGEFEARSWDQTNWATDNTAARRELGWEPKFDLHHGLGECAAWAERADGN